MSAHRPRSVARLHKRLAHACVVGVVGASAGCAHPGAQGSSGARPPVKVPGATAGAEAAAGETEGGAWVLVRSSACGMAARFPIAPTPLTRDVGPTHEEVYRAVVGRQTYTASCVVARADAGHLPPSARFDFVRDTHLRVPGRTIVKEEEAPLGHYPGRVFITQGDQADTHHVRVVANGRALVVIEVDSRDLEDADASVAMAVEGFLESVAITSDPEFSGAGLPRLPSGAIGRPQFVTASGSLAAGTVFFLRLDGEPRVLGVTALHLFGPPGGLEAQIPAAKLKDFVRSVSISSIGEHEVIGSGGPMVAIPGARLPARAGDLSTDIAAFWAGDRFGGGALRLAARDPRVGDTVFLHAEPADGAAPGQYLFRAHVLSVSATALTYSIEATGLGLAGTSGAPLVDASGDVVGIHLAGGREGARLVGAAHPLSSLRRHLAAAIGGKGKK